MGLKAQTHTRVHPRVESIIMRHARLVNSHRCHVLNPPKARNTRHTITLRYPKAEIFAGKKRNAECFAESRQRQTTAPNFVTHPFTGELQQAISEISSFPFSYILIITNSTPESFHRNHHEISSAESKVRERFQIKPPSTAKDQTTQILKLAVHLKARYNAGVKKTSHPP
ncbi:hypothetical protein Bca101_085654 [Brassica carinata]